jgi:hypothetical protein
MEIAQEHLDRALEACAAKYQADEEACREHFLEIQKECAEEVAKKIDSLNHDYQLLKIVFDNLK